jgi:hypothetical protein
MHLQPETVDELFSVAGENLQQDGDLVAISFVCEAGEGCGFTGGEQLTPIADDLARRVMDELGGEEFIYHGFYHSVWARCSRPTDGEAPVTCERDRGAGYRPHAVGLSDKVCLVWWREGDIPLDSEIVVCFPNIANG